MLRREGRIFTNMRAQGALLVVGLLGATAGGALGFSPECGMGSFGTQLRSPSPSCCSVRSPAPASLQLAMKEEGAKGDNDVFTGGEQLKIMMMRTRLEEENLESRLKARTVHLPFEEAVKWTRAVGRWSSEEEWKEWIEMGEGKNTYIPSRPDEYFGPGGRGGGAQGCWKGWDYWLGTGKYAEDSENSAEGEEEEGGQ